jgi:hypothetical protein
MRSVNPNKRLRHWRRKPVPGGRRAGGLPVWDTQYFTSRNFYFTEPRRARDGRRRDQRIADAVPPSGDRTRHVLMQKGGDWRFIYDYRQRHRADLKQILAEWRRAQNRARGAKRARAREDTRGCMSAVIRVCRSPVFADSIGNQAKRLLLFILEFIVPTARRRLPGDRTLRARKANFHVFFPFRPSARVGSKTPSRARTRVGRPSDASRGAANRPQAALSATSIPGGGTLITYGKPVTAAGEIEGRCCALFTHIHIYTYNTHTHTHTYRLMPADSVRRSIALPEKK